MTENPEGYGLLVSQITTIMTAINNDEPITILNETSLLIKTLDEEFKKEHPKIKKLEKKIKQLITNPKNNRIIRLNNIIKKEIETYIEYLDRDIGQDERLYYQEQLEEELTTITEEIRELLSLIIKHKLTDEINI